MKSVGLALRSLLAVVSLFGSVGTARADDVSDLEGLLSEQIVSSASKRAEGASSAPALSANLTAEDLRRYGIRTLSEAIDFLAIAVASSDNLSGGEIGARGVLLTGDRGSHFLLLVDGHVVNDPLRGGSSFGARSGIPLELVDHIEVIVGPGSVLYGSNAMFGLVNVVTKRAKDYPRARVILESTIPTSIRAGVGTGQTFTWLGQDGELTAQLEYQKQAGPDLFFDSENTGIDRFTGQPGRNSRTGGATGLWGGRSATHSLRSEGPSGLVRVALGNSELELQGSHFRHGEPGGPGDFDDPDTGERETHLLVGLKHHIAVSTLLELSARGYASYYESRSDFIASRGVLCPFGLVTCDYVNTGSAHFAGVEMQSTWNWFRDGRFVSILGADARQRHVSTSSDTLNIANDASLYPAEPGLNHSDVTVAAYGQQTWAPTQAISFSGGARVDSDPRFDPVVTPRVAVSLNPWTGGTIKMSYSTAFRAPSWDESDNSTARRIRADGLRAERVQSAELSAHHRFGAHRLVVGGFYSQWDSLVELAALSDQEAIAAIRNGETSVPFTPGIQLTQYRNTSDVTNYGMNTGIEGGFNADHVLYGFTLTCAVAERHSEAGTARLPVAPQLFGNARLAFVLAEPLTIALATRIVGPRPADLSNGEFRPDPYAPAQVELRLTLSGNVTPLTGLSYRVMANYATADRGAYVVGPVTRAIPTQTEPQLNPVDQFRTTAGLQYEF